MDLDPRLTLDQYRLLYGDPNGPRDRYVAERLAATTRGDLTAFTLYTPYGPNRDEGRALVHDLRDPAGPLAPPAGATVLVGGGAADVVDVVDRVAADFPRTALFIIVTTYLVLFVLLRSVVLPAKALVMNTLSIVASFGALVWIFQDGNLSAVLGFQPLGFVETTQPVILFCVLFGLSMDYEVFLLSRMKEVWDRTGDNTEAVARGLERSGRIVTSAALIVVLVAGSFAFADIVLIKALGHRDGDRGRARRHRRPGPPRAGDDAPPRPLELVDAGVARTARRQPPAGVGGRGRGVGRGPLGRDSPMSRSVRARAVAAGLVAVLVAGCSATSGGGRSWPTRPRRGRRCPCPPRPRLRAVDPVPIVLPRDDGPHDRLTEWWYDTGHLRATDGTTLRVRVRHLPRRARRLPDVVGLAPGDHRRVRGSVRLRAAARRRVGGRRLAARPGWRADGLRPQRHRARPDRSARPSTGPPGR